MRKVYFKGIVTLLLSAAAVIFADEFRTTGEIYKVNPELNEFRFTAPQGALLVRCTPETVLENALKITAEEALKEGSLVELKGIYDKRYDRGTTPCFSTTQMTCLPEDSLLSETDTKYLVRGRLEIKDKIAFLRIKDKTVYILPRQTVYLRPVTIGISNLGLHDTVVVYGKLSGETIDASMVTVTPNILAKPEIPGIPRVLLIGDSVSMAYTPFVRELLEGKVNVQRIPDNGGPTPNMAGFHNRWLGAYWEEGFKWDLIHFNFGLHDLRITEGKNYTDLETYKENLRQAVAILKKTGAKLVWASTTPVPEGANPGSTWGVPVNSDVIKYNEAAAEIMKENGVVIDDLYTTIYPGFEKYLNKDKDIHYSDAGSKIFAAQISKVILEELAK